MILSRVICAGLCVYLSFSINAAGLPDVPKQTIPGEMASLQKFVIAIWADSPAVLERNAEYAAAKARAQGASKPLYNPSVEMDAESTDINTLSIGFSQTLDWANKQDALEIVAQKDVQSALADLMSVRQKIAVEALSALVDYYTAQEIEKLSLRGSDLMKGFKDTMDQRQKAGDVRALDVTLAHLAYSEALMNLAASESELAVAKAAVQAVSDIRAVNWPGFPDEFLPPKHVEDDILLAALPDLIVLRRRFEADKARINTAKTASRMSPTIGVRAGREDTQNLIGFSIEVPLFVRNNFSAEVLATAQDALAAELVYRNAYKRAKARLRSSFGRFKNTRRAWGVWMSSGDMANREQLKLLRQLWQAGELNATDFLIQAKQNIDTQSAATRLESEAWLASVDWLAASGQIDTWLGLDNRSDKKMIGESK